MTLDPATRGCIEFIGRAMRAGVVIAIGHTEASSEEIHAAVEAGARLSTHLGNGCAPVLPRHENPIWPQLTRDELYASIICDGFHLLGDVVRSFVRAKGIERLILVTDATHVAGLPAGRYQLVATGIELLPSGKVIRADGGSLAGSSLTMDRAVERFLQLGKVSLSDALRAAAANPAALLQRSQLCGGIDSGAPANLVRFRFDEGKICVTEMCVAGSPAWE